MKRKKALLLLEDCCVPTQTRSFSALMAAAFSSPYHETMIGWRLTISPCGCTHGWLESLSSWQACLMWHRPQGRISLITRC